MGTMATKRYADDYETVITTDEKGNEKKTAVYRGEYFEISLDEAGLTNFKRKCLMLLATIILLHISGGFIDNQGMYQFYVALPYVTAFFPLLYLAVAILRLPNEKRNYRRDEVGFSFDRVKTSSYILIVLMGFGILGEIVYLLAFSSGQVNSLELLYLLLEVCSAAAVYVIIILQRKILFIPIANNNKKNI